MSSHLQRNGLPPDSPMITKQAIDALAHQMPRWLEGRGKDTDIVISSRIRLARNLVSIPFPGAAHHSDLERVVEQVYDAVRRVRVLHDATPIDMEQLDALDRKFLVERRLISPVFADSRHPALVVVGDDELVSIMVNEEDHLRIQSIQPGFGVRESWRLSSQLDDEFAENLDYAFSDQYGYLTSCPTNTGSGLRVSMFVHLPALTMLGKAEEVMRELAPHEIAIRGFYGEGTEVIGNIFQISNQLTLGCPEMYIILRLEEIGKQVLDLERESRERLWKEQKVLLEDQVFRALGILQNARVLSAIEFLTLWSMMRLGLDLEIINGISREVLNQLMMTTQPAHLQKQHQELSDVDSRDVMRAIVVRDIVGGNCA
jgi:protein arginine kinase